MLNLKDLDRNIAMSTKEFPRWQWIEFPAKSFTEFHDLGQKPGWFDLGPVGSGRVEDAWRSGAKPGTTFFLTTSSMVAVKVTLLAILPHGALFARTTNPSLWVACRSKVTLTKPRKVITMYVEQVGDGWKVDFTTLAGITVATAEVKKGATLEDAILKVDKSMPKGPIRLLFDVTEITPCNVRSKLGDEIKDSWDAAPKPECMGGMGLDEALTRQMKELKKRIKEDGSYLPVEKKTDKNESGGKPSKSKPVKKPAGKKQGAKKDNQDKSTKTDKKVLKSMKKPANK